MKLTPQQQKIVDYLADGEWHCITTANLYIKDDRKRISELSQLGFGIESILCDGRCGVRHTARLLMRRLVGYPALQQKSLLEENH